ncbi:tRNA (cytidine(34)-2'-O)-methyltransferase [Lentibacillus amyloliquefaciens]|uniref:Putative tRNA (cytidine(34)-2'-O)-methyltransferase n=1 Tax=Lentibacillus amyloliquefaciens TaxID=1472767 RepID=A0A0U3WFX8_9BACI|nr:tRNA (cytidine(34)-2'-O)-methyltransferase [Lentibacillus amyloliquefaciens]ALX48751.1 tRNA methyltransferase [Lentibacillus amyloliquefaciens]
MGLHVVLYQPEIPANTGNIARTCLSANATLHLIRPLGFSTDDKMVRRAGLDYWPYVDVREYDSIEALYESYPDGLFYYIENTGSNYYTDYDFTAGKKDLLFVFGREGSGFPDDFLKGKENQCLRVHMGDKVRSLNLANTAAIIVYEALRQQGFPGMK